MSPHVLAPEIGGPFDVTDGAPDRYLANCSLCPWESWQRTQSTARIAWDAHAAQKHGKAYDRTKV